MKRTLAFLTAALALAPAAQAETNFRMAFVAPPPVWGPIADRFAKHVAEKTNGAIKITALGGYPLNGAPGYAFKVASK